MVSAASFLESVAGYTQARGQDQPVRMGTIDSAYVAASWPGTLPKVVFDGETAASGKRYPVVGSYWPAASDRVVLIPVGGTYAIIGAIDADASLYLGGNAGGHFEPGWTTHTPTWTSTGTQPAINNGTAAARYRRVPGTKQVIFEFAFTMGAGTTYGTGYYYHGLPVAASADSIALSVGVAYLLDGGTADRPGAVHIADANQVEIISSAGHCSTTVPWTWAATDKMIARIEYEAAS